MQSKNRILDDFARMTSGALGTLAEFRREVETMVRHQFDRVMSGMDLVSREEFEIVRAMAEKARNEQEDMSVKHEELLRRVAALEAALAAKPAAKPARARKSTGRKASTTKPKAKAAEAETRTEAAPVNEPEPEASA